LIAIFHAQEADADLEGALDDGGAGDVDDDVAGTDGVSGGAGAGAGTGPGAASGYGGGSASASSTPGASATSTPTRGGLGGVTNLAETSAAAALRGLRRALKLDAVSDFLGF
jgi:hypothetical protein